MEAIYVSCPNPKVSSKHFYNSRVLSTSKAFKFSQTLSLKIKSRESRCSAGIFSSVAALNSTVKEKSTFDVVVVGAGIIGLTIARKFLLDSDLSVAVVDSGVPCSGATGAGQGYIWMAHKMPESEKWELAKRSKRLWEELAENIADRGMDPLKELGWRKTGSLLIGRTPEELTTLNEKVKLLSEAGLKVEYLSSTSLHLKEPALEVGKESGAAFVPDDCQLDARRSVAFIEKGNRFFASQGRYAEFYHDPALCLLRFGQNGEVVAVETSKNILCGNEAIIIAAGAWSGSLMRNLLSELNISLDVPVTPRKGHLLVVENFQQMQLNHGLMEVGYANHEIGPSVPSSPHLGVVGHDHSLSSVSMTATTDSSGNLVLGSSRQFIGFDTEIDNSIVSRILERAAVFFPILRRLSLEDLIRSGKIRIGLRPYTPSGKPLIGPVPGLPKVILATGHEGEGLSMALGTAEMVVDMVLGNSEKVDSTPFSVKGGCEY